MMVQMRNQTERLDGFPAGRPVSCEEFQAQMPELLNEGIHDHPHLRTCERCSTLLDELEYIAGIASDLLLPLYEPGESVWKNISASLPKSESAPQSASLPKSDGEAAKLNGHLAGSSAKR